MTGESVSWAVRKSSVFAAHQKLHSYKLLPKAFKGKMNVAVILNPTQFGFNFICCKCWSMDVVLDMDLFSTSQISNFVLFFFFENHLNEQNLFYHTSKPILTGWKDEKQKRLEWVGTCSMADHICLYPSLTMWSCLAAWTDTVRHLPCTVEMHADEKSFAQALKILPLKD